MSLEGYIAVYHVKGVPGGLWVLVSVCLGGNCCSKRVYAGSVVVICSRGHYISQYIVYTEM